MIGQPVLHKTFGEGNIVKLEGSYITILFASGEKSFSYPKAFKDQHLVASNDAIMTSIQTDIAQADASEQHRQTQADVKKAAEDSIRSVILASEQKNKKSTARKRTPIRKP